MLKNQGLDFEAVDVKGWLDRLKRYNEQTPSAEALRLNPAVKLVDFYEKTYGHKKSSSSEEDNAGDGQEVKFETKLAERDSVQLRKSPNVLGSGLMGKIVQYWLETWPSA